MGHLVIDVGTSSVRVVVVEADASLRTELRQAFLPSTPFPGGLEFDAAALADTVVRMCTDVLAEVGSVESIGIANQRASTVVWDRATGNPVAPGIGWQDLRTIGTCLSLQPQGFQIAPNASATKVAHILEQVDPDRTRDLCFGTIDSWIAWTLTGGETHITDTTNAAVTGLVSVEINGDLSWNDALLTALRIPHAMLPRIVASSGDLGVATALPGQPRLTAMIGDQQGSLVGQACVRPGDAKVTFGTGGMLDLCTGPTPPFQAGRFANGCFPIAAWRRGDETIWGMEAVMLTAGTAIEWLRDDLQIIATAAESEAVAAQCADTGDAWFVPALLGLGTPHWDYGARGTLIGLTRGTGRPEIVRAVLEGVAHRAVDMVEAAQLDGGLAISTLRIDGGMSVNRVFAQAIANASQRPVEVSPVVEATALGAGFLAGLATGAWGSMDDIAATWKPAAVIDPSTTVSNRDRWKDAVGRSKGWLPGLSAINF
jgi:glycerol kinase